MIITKCFEFEAAHYLPYYEGMCHNIHGHTYKLEVSVVGNVCADGMVIDFGELKRIVKENVIDVLDHCLLNDIVSNPTAENLVQYIGSKLKNNLPASVKLNKIKLYETSSSFAEEYYGD